ncbi:hypothetical protein PG993_001466 [Apiospora rasikravindrae]|uniref:SWI5-dependent HO expression protein 3 n=1 Tax=Apiospora rasikravindrae TaxID=990691 RepID=A0ABR1UED1_9PEZI
MMAEARYNPYANSPKSTNGTIPSTIRTVPSFDAPSDSSSGSPSARNSRFSSSVNSNTSAASHTSQSQNGPTVRLRSPSPGTTTDPQAAKTPIYSSNATVRTGQTGLEPPPQIIPSSSPEGSPMEEQAIREGSPQWDSAVGKAALGKTGRVINKLVSDNEALRRELKVERMKAEEAKQTAKLMEDKIERTVSEYESRLLEANVTKTLLSRKERQVESLQAAVEHEKQRALEALDRERVWKEELERGRRDANVQVDEAKAHATLMEGRYNAIASHWKDQGDEVKRTAVSLHEEIAALVLERRNDDDKINTLRDLCDQQDGNIRDLREQKDSIDTQFEEYKREQENLLGNIKRAAREREEEQRQTIEETKRVLGELRWALNVKKNVAGAQ